MTTAATTRRQRLETARLAANTGPNDPAMFDAMTAAEREALLAWIAAALRPRKTPNADYTSYGLKHVFEGTGEDYQRRSDRVPGQNRLRELPLTDAGGGFYVTNGQFKGAMVAAGYAPVDAAELNWVFRFRWARRDEADHPAPVRAQTRGMSKAERRAYLRARGWVRISGYGAEAWHSPAYPADRGFYSLAAATYRAVAAEEPEVPHEP